MRQIRTTGQCLMDDFQNGLSSFDNRRTNSLKRSITSPTGIFRWGSATVSSIAAIKQQESCKTCRRRNLTEKAGFYAVAISKTGEQIGYGSSQMGAHGGKSGRISWFWCKRRWKRSPLLHEENPNSLPVWWEIRTVPERMPALERRRSGGVCIRRCLPDHPRDRRLEPGLQLPPVVAFRFGLSNQPRAH
jgi:hypothetical protein